MNLDEKDRIGRALDGGLSEGERAAFYSAVVGDGELRSAYAEQAWIAAALRAQGVVRGNKGEEGMRAEPSRWWMRRSMPGWIAAAASVALCAGVALGWISGRGTGAVAVLEQADNCRWAASDLPTKAQSALKPGTLALAEGMATLRFHNGARVTMEAPTTLEILDGMHCRLHEGSVVAEVPEPAHGFTIETADIHVVDLGTRFGLTSSRLGDSQVRVFDGEVEVVGLSGGVRRLREGRGLNVPTGSTAAGQEPARARVLENADGWTSVSTGFGRGKDGSARRGDGLGPQGKGPLLLVKHTELAAGLNNERRAVLTFDLSQTAHGGVAEVELVLETEPSGLGFSALVPDSHFALYGVEDESLDFWDEAGLLWDTVPGCDDGGPIAGKTRRLGEFEIARGAGRGALTVRGDALAEFVRADGNGLVTFLLVRESGESDPSGLVHAFASKEHPGARPPTLRFK